MKRGAQWAIASRTRSSAANQDLLPVVAEVLEEDDGAVAPGGTGDRAAGMGGGAGLVEPCDRQPVLRPAGCRPTRAVVRPAAVTAVNRAVPHVLVVLLDVDRALDVLGEDDVVG